MASWQDGQETPYRIQQPFIYPQVCLDVCVT